jgi:hypothetical protein
MTIKTTHMRQKLVDAIIELSDDEFMSYSDLIELAKESDEQLVDRVISIAQYYKNLYNERD